MNAGLLDRVGLSSELTYVRENPFEHLKFVFIPAIIQLEDLIRKGWLRCLSEDDSIATI